MRPKVVVLGMMTKIPVGGVVWQTVHYVLGLQRLGYDVYYVEAHGRTPSMFMERPEDDGTGRAAAYIAEVMGAFGLGDRWAYHAIHDDGAFHGMSAGEVAALYDSAEALINLHGGTEPLAAHAAHDRLVYVETDPVQLQVELLEGRAESIAFLEPHCALFSFGENLGRPDCGLPVAAGYEFLPTRQPVVLDLWEPHGTAGGPAYRTVANWEQKWRDVHFNGVRYGWSKHHEFAKFLDLPARTGARFELALSSCGEADQRTLADHGWHVSDGLALSLDRDAYRAYIAGARGEFTVAKDQNVRLRTGWFSDRSATFLAAGHPVVTQDTGFGSVLPTGEGLFAVADVDEAADAIARIEADPARARRAATEIAREFFDAERVLGDLLERAGVARARKARAA